MIEKYKQCQYPIEFCDGLFSRKLVMKKLFLQRSALYGSLCPRYLSSVAQVFYHSCLQLCGNKEQVSSSVFLFLFFVICNKKLFSNRTEEILRLYHMSMFPDHRNGLYRLCFSVVASFIMSVSWRCTVFYERVMETF